MLFILANKNKITKKKQNYFPPVAALPPSQPHEEEPVVAFDIIYDCSTNISYINNYVIRKCKDV